MSAAIQAFVRENQPRLLEELKNFVRIPSISTLPEHRDDIERAAAFVADGLHSPNEKYKIDNYYLGIMTIAHFFEQYADGPRG